MVIPLDVYTDTRSPEAFLVSMAEDHDEKAASVTATAHPTTEMSESSTNEIKLMTKDEYHLATLGYRQVLVRGLGLFENWTATFTTMNFVSGMPILLGFAPATSRPQAACSNGPWWEGFLLSSRLLLPRSQQPFQRLEASITGGTDSAVPNGGPSCPG